MKKRLLSRAAALLTASLLALQLAGCGASSGGSAENATAADHRFLRSGRRRGERRDGDCR